tara:strand:+ start:1153 stop:1269 length:117 start_codon:yes stop_codon:yes gene_type:complete
MTESKRKAIIRIIKICDKYDITPSDIDHGMVGEYGDME